MAAKAGCSSSSSEQLESPSLEQDETCYLYEPEFETLPPNIQEVLKELQQEFDEGDVTEKGYQKKRAAIITPFLKQYETSEKEAENQTVDLIEPALDKLPKTALNALAVLKEELDNEEITEKGYNKKRVKILDPFMLKEPKREDLPKDVQFKYKELDQELMEGDITEKGYKKKRMKLVHPYLVAVHPTSYKHSSSKRFSAVKGALKNEQNGLQHEQQIMENGQKLFKCKICGETFKQAQSYSGHCRLHRGDRMKLYKCSFCNATYTTNSHLKYHMFKHTGDFPFTCTFCSKGFAGKSQLKYHELRHTGDAPHSCNECGSRFWRLTGLTDHKSNGCLNHKGSVEKSNDCRDLMPDDLENEDSINSVHFPEEEEEDDDDGHPPSMTSPADLHHTFTTAQES